MGDTIFVGVLALQGAFNEHVQLLRIAGKTVDSPKPLQVIAVRTPQELSKCSALIIPGGESTTMALIAERSNLLTPLRDFVKLDRRPTWGTCAGMILLSESANRTKQGGQELIGGLSVRVNRNHFGRQVESFQTPLALSFLGEDEEPFSAVFIRAPIVESILPKDDNSPEVEVHAPAISPKSDVEAAFASEGNVEILAVLERNMLLEEGINKADRPLHETNSKGVVSAVVERDIHHEKELKTNASSIVAVRQGNVVGTSFHPELTGDVRMHRWWLKEVLKDLEKRELLLKQKAQKENVKA
ncbi:Senecionine N-oxygenase [Rhizina undulata]